jgi:hypothetical protein
MPIRPRLLRGAVLLLLAAFAIAGAGCQPATDASDPDPHYYKGKQFVRKRTE